MKTTQPDLLLVNPGNRTAIYQSLGNELSALEPPVWAGLMATFVRGRGHSVEILDANAENLSPTATAARVNEIKPRVAAVVVYGHNPSASTQVMPSAGEICAAIKQSNPEQKIILIGGHVSALPERTLQEEEADFVATGEGLHTLADLVSACKESSSPKLAEVRGLGFFQDDHIRFNSPAPLVRDLDTDMPGMAWDLLPMELYRAHNWHCFDGLDRQPYGALYTTLGCPFKCSFCCIQAPFKSGEKALGMKDGLNSYRRWSAENVLKQIDHLVKKHGVRNFKFADEMFVLHPKHVNDICDGLIARDYDLNIWAYARVDTVKDNMVDKLRRAGFRWLAFGIEAASADVRDDVSKGYQQDDIFRTLEKVRAGGIYIGANYIFGLPEDNVDSMQATLDLALEVNAEYANFYSAMAYPGSALYSQALQQGWNLPDTWAGYSQHAESSLPLPTRHLTGGEVLAFRDHAFQVYFNAPGYLAMVERKFGLETVHHIQAMNAHRLSRTHAALPATIAA